MELKCVSDRNVENWGSMSGKPCDAPAEYILEGTSVCKAHLEAYLKRRLEASKGDSALAVKKKWYQRLWS